MSQNKTNMATKSSIIMPRALQHHVLLFYGIWFKWFWMTVDLEFKTRNLLLFNILTLCGDFFIRKFHLWIFGYIYLYIILYVFQEFMSLIDAHWLGMEVRPCIGRKGKMSWFMVALPNHPICLECMIWMQLHLINIA